jgi:hypothetical protein
VNKAQLEKQMQMLHKELCSVDKRCKRIAKACDIPSNDIISWAVQQTEEVLRYIESLKEKENEL